MSDTDLRCSPSVSKSSHPKPPHSDLFYLYQGQRIPLNQRQDAIAVSFKKVGRTRGLVADLPLYLQLQQDLRNGSRDIIGSPKVSPLGENYALVNLPKGTRDIGNNIQQSIQKQPYVQATLPVLTRSQHQEIIVLPNEIILSLQPELSQRSRQFYSKTIRKCGSITL